MQFVIHPGGDPSRIEIETDGELKVKEDGVYVSVNGKEVLKVSSLKAYQGTDEVSVNAHIDGGTLRFKLGKYDRTHTLIIDPVITAILAGSGFDMAEAVEVDRNGNVFVTGITTYYSDFSVSRTVFPNLGGVRDIFVSKLSSDLNIHYATAIIGSSVSFYISDFVEDIAIDSNNNVVIVGRDAYSDFGPSRTYFTSGPTFLQSWGFITKLTNDLSTHITTALIGGSGEDKLFAVAIDGSGYIYVSGWTSNYTDYAPSRTVFGGGAGNQFSVVSKFSPDLSTHISTAVLTINPSFDTVYPLGNLSYDIDLDNSGNVFITGYYGICGGCYPDVSPVYIHGTIGGTGAFVTKLSSDLSSHLATAVISGFFNDYGNDVHIDSMGNVFVAGSAMYSSTFAPSRTVFGNPGGWGDAFVTKLSNDLSTHINTAILGSVNEEGAVEAIPYGGYVFVVGSTNDVSTFIPGSVIFGTSGGWDVFVTKLSGDLSSHVATAILAGSDNDLAGDNGLYVTNNCKIYVAGYTRHSSDFSESRIYHGTPSSSDTGDAFVSTFPCPLGFEGELDVKESPSIKSEYFKVKGKDLHVYLTNSDYVGYDLYSSDGRLIERRSAGYLPPGTHSFRLSTHHRGKYVLKVRIGDKVYRERLILR